MNQTGEIPVRLGRNQGQTINQAMVSKILNQLKELLVRFLESGESGVVDMRLLPRMNAATYKHIKDILSTGEVTALIEAEVNVEIRETQYAGVWWLTHHNEQGGIVTELIEVSRIPGILASHVSDMHAGLKRLEQAVAI